MKHLINVINSSCDLQQLSRVLSEKSNVGVYPRSVQFKDDSIIFMCKIGLDKRLMLVGQNDTYRGFAGEAFNGSYHPIKVGHLNHENAEMLRRAFSWTAPQALGNTGISLGLGDRLGLAGPGHLAAIAATKIRPVLAQQSARELSLTQRTYADVLDAATFAVFQAGYTRGFGADGDHLKTGADIAAAIAVGLSMITLDCSEHIDNDIAKLDDAQVERLYQNLPSTLREALENKYLGKEHVLAGGYRLLFTPSQFYRAVLVYRKAIVFSVEVFHRYLNDSGREIDFEISIDEVATPTTPQDHYFIARELVDSRVALCGLAPKFCGSLEKGIDYIGDLEQFGREFKIHALIAEHFGYKISIHSGSDKFSIFPLAAKYSGERLHVKTAGTSWLETLRVIALVNPELFHDLYGRALATLDQARQYYVVSLNEAQIPELSDSNGNLTDLLDLPDVRQALHITYGFMFNDPELKQRIYQTLAKNEALYKRMLVRHFGKHLRALGY